MEFFETEKGSLRAKFEPEKVALSDFLEGDVQGNPIYCREVIDEALGVKTGRQEKWEIDGNAYSLTVTKDKALLEGLWEEGMNLEVPIDDFIQAVSGWLKFLESPDRKPLR